MDRLIVEGQDIQFQKLYWEKYAFAFIKRRDLLETNWEVLKKDSPVKFFTEIIACYKGLSLFSDKEIIDKFRSLGINPDWLFDLDEIFKYWEDICESGEIILLEYYALNIISDLIESKINIAVRESCEKIIPEKLYNQVKNIFRNYGRRQSYRRQSEDKYRRKDSEVATEAFSWIENLPKKEEMKFLIRKISRGKLDGQYIAMLAQIGFIPNEDIGIEEYLYRLFPLTKFLL